MSTPPSPPARDPARELARGRVWYVASFALLLALMWVVIAVTDGDPRVYWPAAVLGAAAFALATSRVWRCPYCRSPLGQRLFRRRCGICGRSLRITARGG